MKGKTIIKTDFIPTDKEKYKKNLINIYDVINKIASELDSKEIDLTNLFYTKKEIENLKDFL